MPLIHIYLAEGKSNEYHNHLSDGIHEALMETWEIPEADRFHIIHEKKLEHLMMDRTMWEVKRSDDLVILHITSSPRSRQMKLTFYKRLPEILGEKIGLRAEDLFISINTNEREDWSFGKGQAQLLK